MNNAMTFQGAGMVQQNSENAMVAMTKSQSLAEVQGKIFMAKSFPRDIVRARQNILNACQRPKLAETATYSYPRGGENVTGPSIRLAEVICQHYGNIDFGIRELSQTKEYCEVQAFAWDMENNIRQEKIFQVPNIRHTKRGDKLLTDPREIYENVANQGARRLRACILGLIPGDIVEEAVEECEKTLDRIVGGNDGVVSPETIKSLEEVFRKMGVSRRQIEQRIQRNLDSILPGQVIQLRKIFRSVKEGMSGISDWFEPEEAAKDPVPKAVTDKLGAAIGSAVASMEGGADPAPEEEDRSMLDGITKNEIVNG